MSSAGSLARSLQALRTAVQDPAIMDVVQLLATKPMQVCCTHATPVLCHLDCHDVQLLAVKHMQACCTCLFLLVSVVFCCTTEPVAVLVYPAAAKPMQ